MIAENSNQTAIGSALQKRSLFNKPSWSRPQALSNDSDLFHRSSQSYADLVGEAERARKRKLARKHRGKVRQSMTGERAGKRRRTSEEGDDEDDDEGSDESSSHSSRKEIKINSTQPEDDHATPHMSPRKPTESPKSLLRRYEAKAAASKIGQEQRQKPKVSDIIDLEDEQDSSALSGQESTWNSAVVKFAAPDEDDQPVSDEEFPELARQAREKARRKRLEEDVVSITPNPRDGQTSLPQPMPPTSLPDPIIQILITSDINNTTPLIVSRRLSQRMKDVRLAWVKRQNFTAGFTDTVCLTWRGKRVFDVTTCKSLGITVDAVGRISTRGGSWEGDKGQVHIEAMTTQMLEAYKESKRNEASSQDDYTAQEAASLVQDHEAQVRIILKAKGLDDFKLQVRPVRHSCVDCSLCWLTSVSLLSSPRSLTLFVLDSILTETKTSSYPLTESDYCLTAESRKRSLVIWTLLKFIVDRQSLIDIFIRKGKYVSLLIARYGGSRLDTHSTRDNGQGKATPSTARLGIEPNTCYVTTSTINTSHETLRPVIVNAQTPLLNTISKILLLDEAHRCLHLPCKRKHQLCECAFLAEMYHDSKQFAACTSVRTLLTSLALPSQSHGSYP